MTPDLTADRADLGGINAIVHEKVRTLIAAGLESHGLNGCSTDAQNVAVLEDGAIAFLGSCPVSAHATPAGGI